jgi:uncharacterized protein YegP (UPF0339 family)
MAVARFELSADVGRKWRWRLLDGNSVKSASSGESFDSRSNAKRAAHGDGPRVAGIVGADEHVHGASRSASGASSAARLRSSFARSSLPTDGFPTDASVRSPARARSLCRRPCGSRRRFDMAIPARGHSQGDAVRIGKRPEPHFNIETTLRSARGQGKENRVPRPLTRTSP